MSAASSIVVLKFGSSVLRNADSLPIAVAEIYRHYRDGTRVIAVVSAFQGVTDQLLASVNTAADSDRAALASLLSTGETASAAHLTMALHRAGIPARAVDPREFQLTAAGNPMNAELVAMDVKGLKTILNDTPVILVPGFFAQSSAGGVALLGRGGSDLTALFLAAQLKAGCILLKDVEGLYEADPATAHEAPRRYAQAHYETAAVHAGPLVQPKAIQFARAASLPMDLARVGSSTRTRIAEGPTILAADCSSGRIRVALLGLGTVGSGVLDYLSHFPERFDVKAALVRDVKKTRDRVYPPDLLVGSMDEVLERKPQIVIEALPGMEPALSCSLRALEAGARFVTANKALIAERWEHFASQLAGPRRPIRFAAAVGGAVPMVEMIERLKLRYAIVEIRGVVNATCNYIMDRCASGESFADALKRAQALGIAEADPSADLSGADAARKIEILGRIAFGGLPAGQSVTGIDGSAWQADGGNVGGRVALVVEAKRTESAFTFRVAPRALKADDFLAGARGAENRLEITTRDGTVRLRGLGAGRVPTATAVFADVLEHARVIDSEPSSGL